jgi:NADPH:quinone reductase-like Zn-dependent oxidoreductase
VIGTASAAKHRFLRELGADETVDYTATKVPEVVREVDAVVQMFGGAHGLEMLECLRPGGILVSGQGAWTPGMSERAAELGVRAATFLVDPDGAGLRALARMVGDGRLKVHIQQEFPLAQAAAAHLVVETGHTIGKLVLNVTDPA